ncbi:hypothetical protein Taro_030068 [Colocasia esculenta]|uniref:Heat shock factor binding protein 1 n=1 Tax=Colocasia esculenta TaxID=4460 RepID=A0A843VLI1_COLES|nr:hypothetical protein [Colocasia esculenta]
MNALQGRGGARFVGGGSWIVGARRWRVASLQEGPLRLDLHLEPFRVSGPVGGGADGRILGRSRGPGRRSRYKNDDDEDSQSAPHDVPGVVASDATTEPSLRDLIAQLQHQMATGFNTLNARMDTMDTSIAALDTRLDNISIELHDNRRAPAPPVDDAA